MDPNSLTLFFWLQRAFLHHNGPNAGRARSDEDIRSRRRLRELSTLLSGDYAHACIDEAGCFLTV